MLWSRRHPWIVITLAVLITSFFVYGALKVRVDASTSGMMIKGGDSEAFYEETLEKFGSDNVTVIFVKDKDLFTPEKLTLLEEVHYQLEETNFVDKVESLFSVTNFKSEDGMLSTNPLIDYLPEIQEEADQIKKDALRSPVLTNYIVSPDGTATALNIYVTLDGDDQDAITRFTGEINEIVAGIESEFEQVYQLGNSYTKTSIVASILNDQTTMVPLSVIVLLSLLVISMRSAAGAILPMLTAGSSVIWTTGFMGYVGIPLNILTVIVPSLIIVIGSTEDIHLLSEYIEGLEENKGLKDKALDYMVGKTGTAVMLTALTTFLGFLSITINDITMLKQFGIVASFGLFVNPIATCMLAPVYLHYFGPKHKEKDKEKKTVNEKAMMFLADHIIRLIQKRKWIVFAVLVGGAVLISLFTLNVKVDNDMLSYFKPDSEIRVRSNILHEEIAGTQVFYLRISSGVEGMFEKPKNLKKVSDLINYMEQQKWFDKVFSLTDYLKLIHREMNNGDETYYRMPETKELIAQYLLTLQRDEIERFVSPDFSEINIMVRHNIGSSFELNETVAEIQEYIDKNFSSYFKIGFTGENIMINEASDSIAYGQVQSLSLLLVIIFVIMSILFVNIKAGFLSLVPNFFPIMLVFGVMGIFKIPLNVGTAMVSAIAIGIAVDDTIHFMTRYNKEMRELQDQDKAIEICIRAEITPVMSTSIALSLGFAVVCFSNFVPIINFGFLSALVMIFALLGDLFVTPILLSSTQLITLWDMVKLDLKEEVIHGSELFYQLKPRQVKRVILLGKVLETQKDDTAIAYGDHGDSMFLLLEGSAQVMITDSSGKKSSVATIRPGDVFGEMAMVNPGPRTADIKAVEDMQYLEFDWKGMHRIQMIYPRIAVHLYRNLSRILGQRLKDTTIKLMNVTK